MRSSKSGVTKEELKDFSFMKKTITAGMLVSIMVAASAFGGNSPLVMQVEVSRRPNDAATKKVKEEGVILMGSGAVLTAVGAGLLTAHGELTSEEKVIQKRLNRAQELSTGGPELRAIRDLKKKQDDIYNVLQKRAMSKHDRWADALRDLKEGEAAQELGEEVKDLPRRRKLLALAERESNQAWKDVIAARRDYTDTLSEEHRWMAIQQKAKGMVKTIQTRGKVLEDGIQSNRATRFIRNKGRWVGTSLMVLGVGTALYGMKSALYSPSSEGNEGQILYGGYQKTLSPDGDFARAALTPQPKAQSAQE